MLRAAACADPAGISRLAPAPASGAVRRFRSFARARGRRVGPHREDPRDTGMFNDIVVAAERRWSVATRGLTSLRENACSGEAVVYLLLVKG